MGETGHSDVFRHSDNENLGLAPFEFYDKMELKKNYACTGCSGSSACGCPLWSISCKNVVLMPSYVNIGAYVDEGTMVDTWATVAVVHRLAKAFT